MTLARSRPTTSGSSAAKWYAAVRFQKFPELKTITRRSKTVGVRSVVNRRTKFIFTLAFAALAFAGHDAVAQTWPTKPVIMVVPCPAGGGTDAFARPLSATLSKQLGKQVVIDNRGG